jgi:hypothetical protein
MALEDDKPISKMSTLNHPKATFCVKTLFQ